MAVLEYVLIFNQAHKGHMAIWCVCNSILYGHVLISWDADLKAVELEMKMFRVVHLLISC